MTNKLNLHTLANMAGLPLDFVSRFMMAPLLLDPVGMSLGRRHVSAPETPKQRRARLLAKQQAEVDRDRRRTAAERKRGLR